MLSTLELYTDLSFRDLYASLIVGDTFGLITAGSLSWELCDAVTVYDEEHQEEVAGYAYSVSALQINPSMLDNTATPLPVEWQVVDTEEEVVETPLYTPGGTRLQLMAYQLSSNPVERIIQLSQADMYTNGPDADEEGYQNIKIYYSGSSQSGLILKTTFRQDQYQNARIVFYKGRYLFNASQIPHDRQGYVDIIFGVLLADPVGPGETVVLQSLVCGYGDFVLQGLGVPDIPAAPTNNSILNGRNGTGAYPTSPAPEFNLTGVNAALSLRLGTGQGLTYYQLTSAQWSEVLEYAYHSSILSTAQKYTQALIMAYALPFEGVIGDEVPIVYMADESVNLATNCKMITQACYSLYDGTINLSGSGYNEFVDFTSTSVELDLPYVGTISINPHNVLRGFIRLRVILDATTGNVSYWVYTQGVEDERMVLYGVYTGNCAMQIPIAGHARASTSILGIIANAGTSIATGAVAGGPVGAVGGFASSFINVATDPGFTSRGGGVDTNSGALTNPMPILTVKRRDLIRVDDYGEINGYPAFETVDLSTLTGFVQVHSVDLSGIDAEDSEKEKLIALLKEGVWI